MLIPEEHERTRSTKGYQTVSEVWVVISNLIRSMNQDCSAPQLGKIQRQYIPIISNTMGRAVELNHGHISIF